MEGIIKLDIVSETSSLTALACEIVHMDHLKKKLIDMWVQHESAKKLLMAI
jgi:hypothetical protein